MDEGVTSFPQLPYLVPRLALPVGKFNMELLLGAPLEIHISTSGCRSPQSVRATNASATWALDYVSARDEDHWKCM